MKIFIGRLLNFSFLLVILLLVLLSLYIVFDPFMVMKSYDSFYDEKASGYVGLNRDFVSTSTFIKNSKKIDYNSFIFGNSRSIFYQISDWEKYLDSNSKCYHFDASSEALWALNKKIEFLDKQGSSLNNILLILDYATLIQDKPKEGHLFVISPPLVNRRNIFNFHKTFFLTFSNPQFLIPYLDFKLSGKVKPYMKNKNLLDDRPRTYDITTNEIRFDYFEKLINEDKYYTTERLSVFYDRDTLTQKYSSESIFEEQRLILKNIQSIFKKHNSKVKVIISPLYDQLKINDKDLDYLKGIFGQKNVIDFSGINDFTNDYKNYYESSHYRPHVARKLLEIVYE